MRITNYRIEYVTPDTHLLEAFDKDNGIYTDYRLDKANNKLRLLNASNEVTKLIDLSPLNINLSNVYISINLTKHIFCIWNKYFSTAPYFKLYDFNMNLKLQLSTPICAVQICQEHDLIWIASKSDKEDIIQVSLYSFEGMIQASISIEDELYCCDNYFFTSLPNPSQILIAFNAGQDGFEQYMLEWKDNEIRLIHTLPWDSQFLFTLNNDTQAILVDSSILMLYSYPDFKEIVSSDFPADEIDEYPEDIMDTEEIIKLSDTKLLVFSESRYFIIDPHQMKIIDELILEDHETLLENCFLYPDINYIDNKLIFTYKQDSSLYAQTHCHVIYDDVYFD